MHQVCERCRSIWEHAKRFCSKCGGGLAIVVSGVCAEAIELAESIGHKPEKTQMTFPQPHAPETTNADPMGSTPGIAWTPGTTTSAPVLDEVYNPDSINQRMSTPWYSPPPNNQEF